MRCLVRAVGRRGLGRGGLGLAVLVWATAALAQSTTPPPAPAAQANAAPAAPIALSKRLACRAGAQSKNGQERQDQIQLCLAQARLDCLKQAIDQKVVGPQRQEFVKSCVGVP
jgi:hypothetical protein